MSNNLKKALLKKMDHSSSQNFDALFFEKLEKEKAKKPGVFSNWIAWAISGCATASVIFIAATNYNIPAHSFNHQEYVESALEIQSTINDDISNDDMIDLTTSSPDEI